MTKFLFYFPHLGAQEVLDQQGDGDPASRGRGSHPSADTANWSSERVVECGK